MLNVAFNLETMKFKAYITEETDEGFVSSVKETSIDDLPEGNVLIKVLFSSLNYKDMMVFEGNPGLVRKYPHVPGVDVAGIVEQVLGAVSYCHDRAVAHQDLKPDNILLAEPAERKRKSLFRTKLSVPAAVVADFGQAATFGFKNEDGTDEGFKLGDPRYSSPDAWRQKGEMGNDIWAVGVTCYELLSGGILPFLGKAVTLREFAEKKMWRQMKAHWRSRWKRCARRRTTWRLSNSGTSRSRN